MCWTPEMIAVIQSGLLSIFSRLHAAEETPVSVLVGRCTVSAQSGQQARCVGHRL